MTRKKRTIRMIVLGEMIALLAIAGVLTLMASTLSAENTAGAHDPGQPVLSAGPDSTPSESR
jgi:hypothetical protein